MRKMISLLTALFLVLGLSACGSNTSNTATTSNPASEDQFPITIKHAFGKTVIEEKPERIVTLGWENQDTPLALGMVPVGVSAANYGAVTEHNLHAWSDEAFAKLGEEDPNVFNDTDGYDYEAISDADPDVILMAYSGLTQEDYDLLSEIAPVVPYKSQPWQTTWKDQTIENATALGLKEEAEKLVSEVEATIEEKKTETTSLQGKKGAFFYITPDDFSSFYVYLPTDPRAAYLEELGLELPDSVKELGQDTSDFSVTLSRENVDQLKDVEVMVVYGDQQLLEDLQADELMSQIPAIKNGAVVLLDSESELAGATTPSILSIPATIDEYMELLGAAADQVK